MLKFSKLFAAAALAASALVATAPAQAAAGDAQNPVKVFYYSLNDLFINQLSASLQDRALANHIKLAQYDANDDLMRQVSQIQAALSINRDHTPILVNPVDTQNGTAALRAARKAKVPVIFFNRKPSDEALKSYRDAWYVGTKPASSAYYQAEIVSDYYKAHPEMDKNKDGALSYVMLKGEAGHQDTSARSNGFTRTLLDQGMKLKPLASDNANWSQSAAQNKMAGIIDKVGINNIEVVVANNDAMALGAILALQAEGYNLPDAQDKSKFIPVVGIDGLPAALDAVERGTMIGTVFNDYNSTADVMVRITTAYLNGEVITEDLLGYPIENQTVYIPYVKVTNDNLGSLR